MSGTDGGSTGVPCRDVDCESSASFRLYEAEGGTWRPVCEQHALAVHPSLEIGVLLESGYLRPVEVGEPDGPPGEPRTARAAAFREEVEALTGWSM